jgi:bifunctional non-homologous end joining protein LigD
MSSGYAPMKAVLTDQAFSDPDWVFERKLDGERCGAIRRGSRVRLLSRTGTDLNPSYPELVDELSVAGPDLLLDGEIVAFKGGQASFERLQQRMQIRDPDRARSSPVAVYYYVFDLLDLNGQDVRQLPLLERKARLRQSVDFRGHLRYTTHRRRDGETAFRQACKRGWEGVIAKRAASPYIAARSRDWLKIKCAHSQELVIGGWTAPKGSRERIGALLVGYYDGQHLRYAGKVGTGFDRPTLHMLGDELERRERDTDPFHTGGPPRSARWAEPELVAEIAFAEWTQNGLLRQPRFEGLRPD